MRKTKFYSDLKELKTFEERFEYLKIGGRVGADTFGSSRYLNQALYKSEEWRRARRTVILRDNGCDLGIPGYDIGDKVIIHHINPITIEDVINRNPDIYNPEFLICVSQRTHNAIHYGDEKKLSLEPIERRPNDTCPWRK